VAHNRAVSSHPIRLTVADDLRRSRLTVFFRLLLAIPHIVWFVLWSIPAALTAIVNWFATLITGTPPDSLHRFLTAYLRYGTHVTSYLFLAANPFPGFTGTPGSYPIDLEVDPPGRQSRWKTGFRLLLAVPVLILLFVLSGSFGGGEASDGDTERWYWYSSVGVIFTVAFLAWFACLARGRMPRGFRNLLAYGLRYSAQAYGYLFIMTEHYPNADPILPAEAGPVPAYPVRVTVADDLRRSRLTVLFRLLLALPHIVWVILWGIAALVAAIASWFATLVAGRSPASLHAFLAAYLRYSIRVQAYVTLLANPFPGFDGRPGGYPVDVEIESAQPQNRWITGFRLFLGIPALIVVAGLGGLLYAAAFLGWFATLATGRMPQSLRNLGAYALRYTAEADGYLLLLTDRYPYSGPPAELASEPEPVGAPA
jgi:hypothetical protein